MDGKQVNMVIVRENTECLVSAALEPCPGDNTHEC